MAANPIPEGYSTVTPYLLVTDASAEIDFLRDAFDAQELMRVDGPGGSVMHAEVKIGDSRVMLADATDEYPAQPSALYLYVEDVDATFARAVAAGGRAGMEPTNQFYGDRQAEVRDANGNRWWISTHVEDVPPDEIERRQQEYLAQRG